MSFFLIFLCGMSVFSQQKILKGRILADSLEVYKINTVNITQEIGTTTKPNGEFSLAVYLRDSIVFSSLVHAFHSLIFITSDLEKPIEISLGRQINNLPEVVLTPYDLSGQLDKDITQVPTYHLDQTRLGFKIPRRLNYPKSELKRVKRFSIGLANSIPIDYIIMLMNGQLSELERYKKNIQLKKQKDAILTYFTPDYITESLGIDSLYVDGFMYFCIEDLQFIQIFKTDKLAVLDSLKMKVETYNLRKTESEQ